jgi:hypothetical protein
VIPQIQISQVFGRIGISYSPMQWNISLKQADVEMHITSSDIEVQQQSGELTIDQTDAFAQEGRLKPLDFAVDQANKAEQVVAQGVEETAQLGNEFMHIERNSNPFSDWALRYADKQVQAVPALVPAPFSVHIHYQLAPVHTQVQLGSVQESVMIHSPQVTFSPGNARTYVEQPPNLQIIPPSSLGHDYTA